MLIFVVIFLLVIRKQVGYVPEISRSDFDCYVINVKTNKSRLDYISSMYNDSDLSTEPFILIDAVDGKVADIKNSVTPRIWEGIEQIDKTGKRSDHGHLTRGMVGCYLSHLKVLEMIQASNKPYGLVLEDDAMFPKDILDKNIKDVQESIPEDWDVILLGRWPLKEAIEKNYVRVRKFWGTHGYLVNKKGAKKIIEQGGIPIDDQIDGDMGKLAREGVLQIYAPYTNVITVNIQLPSQVQMDVSQ